ncbi:hypothetical protein FB45DRAFT_2937 [Roridomyces roridus]|uniref:Fungal-type protein kinase domain-containing protein n=1 Tax=Roridomyces roridus TaxID=1738132 RepID=A0AAD7CKE9_9AGAR|nr:hypothetical protein FB45DRAFT_2937 [Roridomyces roridus]
MYRRIDREIYGVLNDFDLSQFMNGSSGCASDERIGTRLFMALDLLDLRRPPIHLPRHDLESLMYVLVFLVCEIEDEERRRLTDSNMDNAHGNKYRTLCAAFPLARPGFERFDDWIFHLQSLFGDALYARCQAEIIIGFNKAQARSGGKKRQELPEVDDETLGGRVTFDTFAAALCEL